MHGGTGTPKVTMPVRVEIVERCRLAESLGEVVRRGVEVIVHREQAPLDQVRLDRLAEPDRDVGLAHGEVELARRRG